MIESGMRIGRFCALSKTMVIAAVTASFGWLSPRTKAFWLKVIAGDREK